MKDNQDLIETGKRKAAEEAVKHVKDGQFIGLGSGSTAAHAIKQIGDKIRREKLHISAVPTSYQAFMLAVKHGIPITTLEEHPTLDLTIDGADQIDNKLNLIKGMGGALAREKVVASTSKQLIIIADQTKKVKTLGENNQPVPVEALPFAASPVMRRIGEMGGKPVLRERKGKVGPLITDNGNIIIDSAFGPILTPEQLNLRLKTIPGVIETGLFIGMAKRVYIGKGLSTQEFLAEK